jgi:hypothetical protein
LHWIFLKLRFDLNLLVLVFIKGDEFIKYKAEGLIDMADIELINGKDEINIFRQIKDKKQCSTLRA